MSVYDEMIARYPLTTDRQRRAAIQETLQQIALAALVRADFFHFAAFYGGTCLRIFHGLPRFSEDMDFSLLQPDKRFEIERLFSPLRREFERCGRTVEISKKHKSLGTAIESAFLKDTTDRVELAFTTDPLVKVKFEVDTQPPLGFGTESRLLLLPFSCMVRCYDLPSLFAGKVHALLFRKWARRVKGRDWYDFAWYVAHGHTLALSHFQTRTAKTNPGFVPTTASELRTMIRRRIKEVDFQVAKEDVQNFLFDSQELNIWSPRYFTALVSRMKIS